MKGQDAKRLAESYRVLAVVTRLSIGPPVMVSLGFEIDQQGPQVGEAKLQMMTLVLDFDVPGVLEKVADWLDTIEES